jgi:hypothetical protein
MTNPSLLARVHVALAAAGIPTALIGAAALAIHGVSRSTFDQDLLVMDERVLSTQTWAGLESGVTVDIRRGDSDDPLAGVVRLTAANERDVDVVVGRHPWQAEILAEADAFNIDGIELHVVTAPGLVLLKLYAGGTQDLWDIEQLRAAAGPPLDAAVEARLDMLPARNKDAWRRLLQAR